MLDRASAEHKYIEIYKLVNLDERDGTRCLRSGRADDAAGFFKDGRDGKDSDDKLLQTITDLTAKIDKFSPALIEDARKVLLLVPQLTDDLRPYVNDDDYWNSENKKCGDEFLRYLHGQ